MLISEESFFKKITKDLNEKQRLFLDGIRFSIEMVDISFNRILTNLRWISELTIEQLPLGFCGLILVDIWSMVDSIIRLRNLVDSLPGIKKTDNIKKFLRYTENVKSFRDNFQHLNEKIHKGEHNNVPVLGSVSWVASKEKPILNIFLLAAGTITPEIGQMVNPAGKVFTPPLDLITLNTCGKSLLINEQFRLTKELTEEFEIILSTILKNPIRSGADILLKVDFT